MLACARIGAPHSVVFGGFSAESLRDRILDAECRVLITADEGRRGKRIRRKPDLFGRVLPWRHPDRRHGYGAILDRRKSGAVRLMPRRHHNRSSNHRRASPPCGRRSRRSAGSILLHVPWRSHG
jgi:hypothetical protein